MKQIITLCFLLGSLNALADVVRSPVHSVEEVSGTHLIKFKNGRVAFSKTHTAVMQGDVDWKTKRFVSNLTYDRMTHQLTAPATRAMDNGEMITSLDKLPKWLNGEDPIFATDEQLANIATACTMRLARSAASRQPALRHDA